MKYCTKCGSSNEDTAAFCSVCGGSLGNEAKDTAEEVKTETVNEQEAVVQGEASGGWVWLGILTGIAAIIVGAILKGKRWPSLGKKLLTGGIIGTVIEVLAIFIYIIAAVVIAAAAAAAA